GVGLFARGPLGELDGVAHEGEIALDYGRSNNLRVTAFVENRRAGEQTIPSRVSAAAVVQGPCVALDAHALLVRGERWSAMLRDLRHRAEELLLQVLREQKASPADLDAGRRAGLLLLETIQREQQQQLDSEPDGKRKSKRASKRKGKGKSSDTDDDHTLRIDTSRLAERDAEIVGTLRALPLVKGIDEQWLSLDALCDSGEPVGIIPPEADQGPEPWLQGSVVVVDRVQASALRALIGARDVEPLYNQLVQARRRRESAPDRAEVDWRATVVRAKIGRGDLHGDLRGELGLGIPYGRTALTLMSRGRVVETIQPEGATGFVGWLDGPFETDERFTRVLVDESLRGAISELYLERCQAAVRSCLDEKPRSHARYRTLAAHSAHHVLTPLAGMARHACREAVLSGVSPHFDDLTRRLLEAPIIEDVDGRFHSLSQLAARDATFVCCAPDAEERGADRGNALLLRTYGAAILHMLLVLVHGDERVMSLGSWEREQTRAAKVRRAAAERVSANERLMWGLQVALREGVQASGGRHGLTLPLVNSLGLAPDGGARGALVKHDGQQWRLNPKSSTWREAAAAETAGVSSAYYLAAATLRHVSTPELVADQLAALAKAALG
ncbi:MAG: hypothetical protein KC503_22520, partial [Myxococcales bacterium]|nr:hypothetical protein [Myxococcales bacterium]